MCFIVHVYIYGVPTFTKRKKRQVRELRLLQLRWNQTQPSKMYFILRLTRGACPCIQNGPVIQASHFSEKELPQLREQKG